jgi:LuxR family transcriptional regulator, maltose regulon positive regulatory protein
VGRQSLLAGDLRGLEGGDRLDVDLWQLESLLDDADAAEQAGHPAAALAAYDVALPRWRAEPFADVPDAGWAHAERARLRSRYAAAAARAGELLLASGAAADAPSAARRAIAAEPGFEPAYRLVIRAHLSDHDHAGAGRALDEYREALGELDLEPDPSTLGLLT